MKSSVLFSLFIYYNFSPIRCNITFVSVIDLTNVIVKREGMVKPYYDKQLCSIVVSVLLRMKSMVTKLNYSILGLHTLCVF